MICLTATGISSLLLFFYFKNKLSTVEEKLDSMFQLIQNYAAQSEKRSNEAQWRVQETAPSQPLVNAVQETPYVNNSKIVVSDNDSEEESESDSEEESDQESENEEVEEVKVVNQESQNKEESEKSDEEETSDSLDGSEEGDTGEDEDEDEDEDEEEEEDDEEKPEQQETTLETPTIELNMDDDEPEVKNISVKDTIDYERMRVADLKNLARDRGLSGYRNLRKNDLIQLLSQ
jgi:hypothetical protein